MRLQSFRSASAGSTETNKEISAAGSASQVRRQAEVAVQRANAGVSDPAAATARALCVFMRFAVEHRDSAQVLWRLNSGATLVDAPINRNLREIMTRGIELERFKHVDLETGVLVVMGTVVIAIFVITFIVQAFQIPSESMENTLLVGDYLLVNKLCYGGQGLGDHVMRRIGRHEEHVSGNDVMRVAAGDRATRAWDPAHSAPAIGATTADGC